MSARSAEELERALRELGVRCSVEAYDALAVAVLEPGERRLEADNVRRRAIELARTHGFSHLAVELREPGHAPTNRASLSRD
jgi:hypothetical protein